MLHKGRLQAVGSNVQLKEANGTAYHLTMVRRTEGATAREMLAIAQKHVPEATIESDDPAEVSLLLPQKAAGAFSPLFLELDDSVATLGVQSYGLSIPTLQEVFLKITADADAREAEGDNAGGHAAGKASTQTLADEAEKLDKAEEDAEDFIDILLSMPILI